MGGGRGGGGHCQENASTRIMSEKKFMQALPSPKKYCKPMRQIFIICKLILKGKNLFCCKVGNFSFIETFF